MSERVFEVEIKRESDDFFADLSEAGCEIDRGDKRRMVIEVPEGADSSVIFQTARAAGAQIRHLEVRRESLEQAFMRVIGES